MSDLFSLSIEPELARKRDEILAAQKHLLIDQCDVSQSRRSFAEFTELLYAQAPELDIAVKESAFGPVGRRTRGRLYEPKVVKSVIAFIHGGGWVTGSIATHDHICRWLAVTTQSLVVSLEYSLAPEHVFPTAITETTFFLKDLLSAQDRLNVPLFVCGDSAGANIATMAILALSVDECALIAGFISIYGAYAPLMDLPSHAQFGDGRFGLSRERMLWFWSTYIPEGLSEGPSAFPPLHADLTLFPSTLCIAAECDVLFDDSLAFDRHLRSTNVDSTLSIWRGLHHGAMHFVGIVSSVTTAAHSIITFISQRRTQTSPC